MSCILVGIEVFCVITRADYPEIDLESMTDDLAQLLRISEIRIKPVINYTPRDIRSDMTTVLNMEKQKLALEAMLCFLLHSTEPAFSSLPAIPVSEAKCSSSPGKEIVFGFHAGRTWGIWNRHLSRYTEQGQCHV